MKFPNNLQLLIVLSLTIAVFACDEDLPIDSVEAVDEPRFGAVSGKIIDAETGNAIPNAVVILLGQSVKTGGDGRYSFTPVDYADSLTLTVEAIDYATQTRTFALNVAHLVLDIPMPLLTNPDEEIRQFFDSLSTLIASMDTGNIETIQSHFSEIYAASDDPVTRFGLATNVIPANFDKVIPAITTLFEEFDLIQFQFLDIQVEVTHARKAAARLKLDIITEKGLRPDRKEIIAECQIDFRKEESDWKIVFWQLFEVDIRL